LKIKLDNNFVDIYRLHLFLVDIIALEV
jgi:hypothetical protein